MNNNYPDTIKKEEKASEDYYIVFSLKDKLYAINIKNVIEVINIPVIEVPETMPSGITGFFNYKGLMIKSVDLCPLLGFEQSKYNINDKLIIININNTCLAIHTDAIVNIFLFEDSHIHKIPYSAENSILKNIYENDNKSICIIDTENLNTILEINTKRQTSVEYPVLFPDDNKTKQILELRNTNSSNQTNLYSFNFNLVTENQYILFTLNNSGFYLELKYIKEFSTTRRYKLTKLPYTPPYIKGLVNIKGDFLIVIDLKLFLDMEDTGYTKNSKLIILDKKEFKIALLVDDIKYIQNLNNLTPLAFNNNISKYVYAEFLENDKLYTVLNAEKIINDERLYINIE